MAFETGALDIHLASAAGDDPVLMADLRASFLASVERQVDLLHRSRCDGNWHMAAMRLKGVAASFGVDDLITLADEAIDGAPGDPVVLRKLRSFATDLATHN